MKHNTDEDNEELQDNEPDESVDQYLHKLNIKHSKIQSDIKFQLTMTPILIQRFTKQHEEIVRMINELTKKDI